MVSLIQSFREPSFMYIAIEGVIGVGKTTLARLMQPSFDAEVCLKSLKRIPSSPISMRTGRDTHFKHRSSSCSAVSPAE